MSTQEGEDTTCVPHASAMEEKEGTDAPPPILTSHPYASAYVGDIHEMPDVATAMETANDAATSVVELDNAENTSSEILHSFSDDVPDSQAKDQIEIKSDVLEDLDKEIQAVRLASDSKPIVSAKNELVSNSTEHDPKVDESRTASCTANSSPMRRVPASHRESPHLPRVATLYKTMPLMVERSRLASRGEIPFIFRRNGTHVYITNYKDDTSSSAPKASSKSRVASVPPRVSYLAVPKRMVTPNVSSTGRIPRRPERTTPTNDRKPKPDMDDITLDKLLDAPVKVESDASPNDVRRIDSVTGPDDAMKPKNLDATAFSL